ncbi:MAG: hypothetical protein K0S14_41 [Thermomicrobiales bacterium]|jgi:hypothetical protein|nr:hypothetical protein [Thermomicrobiales bacterium]
MALDGDEWMRDYPHREDEGPEARMHRLQLEQEARAHVEIVKLHASLPAKSSDLDLFTFKEMRQWNLKHCRKRAHDEEDDGA